nr:MAG TPA: hypothetical protein [Caudoviricetes sp.]DAS45005.1 MAG TPA: hypothetical protein [Caudoviricetes sp.]
MYIPKLFCTLFPPDIDPKHFTTVLSCLFTSLSLLYEVS